jgi:acetyltransferase-like isoleucine patch superfamily enzyme
MSNPIIKSGKFHAGENFQCGENVVIEVSEEVVLGDRVVLADNTYLCGRRIEIGSDFFGYSWEGSRLDIGRGRIDEEDAILIVGNRSTFHNNRIDLSRDVRIGNNVGLSPDVVLYTHGYWLNPLAGYPCTHAPIIIGSGVIVGFRSVILAGTIIGQNSVIGAQSAVSGRVPPEAIYAGNPAKMIRWIAPLRSDEQETLLRQIVAEYSNSFNWRFNRQPAIEIDFPYIRAWNCRIDTSAQTLSGEEIELTDDLRDFLFKHGIRIYTKRPFKTIKINRENTVLPLKR